MQPGDAESSSSGGGSASCHQQATNGIQQCECEYAAIAVVDRRVALVDPSYSTSASILTMFGKLAGVVDPHGHAFMASAVLLRALTRGVVDVVRSCPWCIVCACVLVLRIAQHQASRSTGGVTPDDSERCNSGTKVVMESSKEDVPSHVRAGSMDPTGLRAASTGSWGSRICIKLIHKCQ